MTYKIKRFNPEWKEIEGAFDFKIAQDIVGEEIRHYLFRRDDGLVALGVFVLHARTREQWENRENRGKRFSFLFMGQYCDPIHFSQSDGGLKIEEVFEKNITHVASMEIKGIKKDDKTINSYTRI